MIKIKNILNNISKRITFPKPKIISMNRFYLSLFIFTIILFIIQITFFPSSNVVVFSKLYGFIFFIIPMIMFIYYFIRFIQNFKTRKKQSNGNNYDK